MSASSIPQKLAIFGGTFDPVHNAHIQLSRWVCKELKTDQVLFIPNFQHPFHKRKNITLPEHRLEMLRIATRDFSELQVETYEIERAQVSYTIDTLRYMRRKYPQSELYILIGADNIAEFDKWKEAEQIFTLCTVAVYLRNLNFQKKDNRFLYLNNPLFDVSSTRIRERISAGKKCDDLIPAEVLNYIRKHKIYQSPL